MPSAERILIVGGGIGGLVAAAPALHRQGFAPELVERSSGSRRKLPM